MGGEARGGDRGLAPRGGLRHNAPHSTLGLEAPVLPRSSLARLALLTFTGALLACSARQTSTEAPVPPPDAAPDPAPDAAPDAAPGASPDAATTTAVHRIATFNAALNRPTAGALRAELVAGSAQARAVAEVVQRSRPAVLVLQEFDHDPEALDLFRSRYLAVGQGGAEPIDYPYVYAPPSNTGVPSGFDLDGDGSVGGPGDAHGFGAFPGQYAFAILSAHPIEADAIRTFAALRWSTMPDARAPIDPRTGEPWYAPDAWAALRLSSKNHVDVPVTIAGRRIHLLVAHPTPPVFDGPEDRNGRRNADEIRLWADYVDPARSGWIVDDAGLAGGLAAEASFVVLGDMNADPIDGDSVEGAIGQLLDHPRIDPAVARGARVPQSEGGRLAGRAPEHQGDPAHDTAGWGLRVDYVLPSTDLTAVASGVFWPGPDDATAALVAEADGAPTSSDHRLVWVDVEL